MSRSTSAMTITAAPRAPARTWPTVRTSRSSSSLNLLHFPLLEKVVDPEGRQFLGNRVLPQPRVQVVEINHVKWLILVETTEDDALFAGLRIHVALQALSADFLHHALHG